MLECAYDQDHICSNPDGRCRGLCGRIHPLDRSRPGVEREPLDCAGVPGAQAAADRESAIRGIAITPLCFSGGLYSGVHAGIPLAVLNPLTMPGTASVCIAERETVEAAARFEWTDRVHVMPMCIQNRAFGVYEL